MSPILMPLLSCGMAAFTVAAVFYSYRAYSDVLKERERSLRERVTYMLWVAAHRAQ